MRSALPYALVAEMLEAPGILRRFDPSAASGWAQSVAAKKRLMLTGEGSSRIFPAKNAINLALRQASPPHICTEGARQAAEYDLSGFSVVGLSNSGRTRELISLFEKLAAENIPRFGITAAENSVLSAVSTECRVLSCGAEKAVAATKSVIEQALVCQSLLGPWTNQPLAADAAEAVLSQDIPAAITDAVAGSSALYFAGRNDGVAEELALKANEIARKKSLYLEGTYALHGIEEVMSRDETVILIEPFREEMEKYRDILQQGAKLNVVAIATFDTPFPTIKIPHVPDFNGYLRIMAGWNVLVAAGCALGVDLDKPLRARKVGNAV